MQQPYLKIFGVSALVTLVSLFVVTLLTFVFATSEAMLAAMETPAILLLLVVIATNSAWMTRTHPDKPLPNILIASLLPAVLVLGYLLVFR